MEVFALGYRSGGWTGPMPAVRSGRTLVLAFSGSERADAPAPLLELVERMPGAVVVGCSGAGEIAGGEVRDGTVSAAAVVFEDVEVASALERVGRPEDSGPVGVRLGERLAARPGLRAVLVFSDGLTVNGTALARGLAGAVGPDVVVTGGLAADGDRFRRTWVMGEGRIEGGHVVAVGLYGDRLQVAWGSGGGWDPFGPERVVTRAEGNVLHELDGKPALTLYSRYLGDRAADLPASALLFPLALRHRGGEGRDLVRTVLSVSAAERSMTFAGDVPEGSTCRLMRANFDRLIDGAGSAADRLARDLPGEGPVLCLAVSCVGRRLVLGERTEEEVELCLGALPAGSVQVGFYSYGELSPLRSGACELHNQTMTLTALREV